MINTFLGPVRISGEPNPFLETIHYHDERIIRSMIVPLMIAATQNPLNKDDLQRFRLKRLNPMQRKLERIVDIHSARLLAQKGMIPHWKGLDTIDKLRPITNFMGHNNRTYRIWDKFVDGLIGPLPDYVPRFRLKPVGVAT